jgi:excisionase family DNA binding protein
MPIESNSVQGGDKRQTPHWRILDPKWDGRSTFTVDETAEILGLSRWSAYAAVKKKEIPVVWIGRRCIVPRLGLERMLAGEQAAA